MAKKGRMSRSSKQQKKFEGMFLGTKPEWVVEELEKQINDEHGYCVYDIIAKDDIGSYYTRKDFVGARMLDPNRMYNRVEPNKKQEDVPTV